MDTPPELNRATPKPEMTILQFVRENRAEVVAWIVFSITAAVIWTLTK